jgi:hypothetical protein
MSNGENTRSRSIIISGIFLRLGILNLLWLHHFNQLMIETGSCDYHRILLFMLGATLSKSAQIIQVLGPIWDTGFHCLCVVLIHV